jgi:cell division protein FtsB
MRLITLLLVLLIMGLQYPLWLSKGSVSAGNKLDSELANQLAKNADDSARNLSLQNEINNLKNGTDAIEEQARSQIGMLKSNEMYFQIIGEAMAKAKADGAAKHP